MEVARAYRWHIGRLPISATPNQATVGDPQFDRTFLEWWVPFKLLKRSVAALLLLVVVGTFLYYRMEPGQFVFAENLATRIATSVESAAMPRPTL
jgi:hypothetical protein